MKAKSRLKNRKDNETPEKCSSDDSRGIAEVVNPKINETYSELKVTKESLQKLLRRESVDEHVSGGLKSPLIVRRDLPLDQRKVPTIKYCVLRKAPDDATAVRPTMDHGGVRLDAVGRVVPHSILGSAEDFFRISLNKGHLASEEIPLDYRFDADCAPARRPFTAALPSESENKENRSYRRSKSGRNSKIDREAKLAPDTSALLLWQKRMAERRALQDHISKKVERTPEQLVFNTGEVVRSYNEVSNLITKSIPFYGSGYGYRVGSEFWNQNEEVGIDEDQLIHMTNTQTQKGYPPSLLHVGVPDFVQREKGVPANLPTNVPGDFFHRRLNELGGVIRELDPHLPDMRELLVLGVRIDNQTTVVDHNSNMEQVENFEPHEKDTDIHLEDEIIENIDVTEAVVMTDADRPGLEIDGVRFRVGDAVPDGNNREVRKIFNGYEKHTTVEYLNLHNLGSSVIRLWWMKIDAYDPFDLDHKSARRFYFRTQDIILLPQERLQLPIVFKAARSGIFTEQWRLCSMPLLTDNLIVSLRGVALQQDPYGSTRLQIQSYLRKRVAEKVCLGLLDKILQDVFHRNAARGRDIEESGLMFTEEEEFVSLNNGIPYNLDVLQGVKKIHVDMVAKEGSDESEWDLDCRALRKRIIDNESLKSEKKEEICDKFQKTLDKVVVSNCQRPELSHRNELHRICYTKLVEFSGDLFDQFQLLRMQYSLPEMELKISREKKRGNMNRQKTNMSRASKTSGKKPSLNTSSVKASAKSRDPTCLTREATEAHIPDLDDGTTLLDEVDDSNQTTTTNLEANNDPELLSNQSQYHYKSLQLVHGLLDRSIDQILLCWSDLNSKIE